MYKVGLVALRQLLDNRADAKLKEQASDAGADQLSYNGYHGCGGSLVRLAEQLAV
jgi:hypothetical protein